MLKLAGVTIDGSTVTFIMTDGRVARMTVKTPPFPPDGPIGKATLYPSLNALALETIRGELIGVELPAEGCFAPMRNRPVVYLDQKDWSSLAKLRYAPARVRPAEERAAAEQIADMANRHRIILPMSAGHMSETCQWPADQERYQLGLTIVQLSGGWQMRDPLDIRARELQQKLRTRFQRQPLPLLEVFTLEPNAIHVGRGAQRIPDRSSSIEEQIEFATEALASVTASIATMLDAESVESNPVPGWVQQAQEFTRWLADRQYSREQKRKLIDGFFISDARLEIASEARAAGITTDELGNWLQKSSRDDIKSMPCLGLFREVLRQKHLNPGTSWEANDLIDMMYLTCASGYADYVVGERSLVSQIKPALRRLGRPINVYSSLRDLISALGGSEG